MEPWIPYVTPRGILPHHADYQLGDRLRDQRSTGSVPGIRPLLRDELTVLHEHRIGRQQSLQFTKCSAPQHIGLYDRQYPLFIIK